MTEARRAEVVGGGIAGLSAATALARRGWRVRLHERGRELREIGAGIFLWENALRGLEAIGALADATARGELDRSWEFRDERLRLLQSGWMMDDARLYTVLRTDLHRALADAARREGVEIRTGSRVESAGADGSLVLDAGERVEADLVVGADGVGSRVRDTLQLGLVVRDLRDGCGRHLIAREPDDPVGRTLEFWDGGRRVGVVPCSPEHVYVYLCCPAADRAGRASPLDAASWSRSFPTLAHVIERIPDVGQWTSFSDVTCHAWSAGRVAILGDAAHAMAPNLGQGAAVSITSAVALAAALDRERDVPAALRAWEAGAARDRRHAALVACLRARRHELAAAAPARALGARLGGRPLPRPAAAHQRGGAPLPGTGRLVALSRRRRAAGAACSAGRGNKGSLAPGKLADLVVLDRDPRTAAVDDLPAIGVHSVYLGGRPAWPST